MKWTPAGLYHASRDQLGSIRGVYLHGNQVRVRRDYRDFQHHVLLLHGFFQTRAIFNTLEERLRSDGFGVISLNLGGFLGRFNSLAVDVLAQRVGEKIERICSEHDIDGVHVIGHSKGGLLARRWVQHLGGVKRVKSVVTLGTPHHGTPTAWVGYALGLATFSPNPKELRPNSALVRALAQDRLPAHIPFTSVYSRHDLVCPWWSSIVTPEPGETHVRNIEVIGVGHSALCWDPVVYRAIIEHLRRITDSAEPGYGATTREGS
jgi:triacylglycerol lipase